MPPAPTWNGGGLGRPALLLLRRYQVIVVGSTMPTVSTPSPSQSPQTGSQPTLPKVNGPASGAPLLLLFRGYQKAVDGSNRPTAGEPLPSQSHMIGSRLDEP